MPLSAALLALAGIYAVLMGSIYVSLATFCAGRGGKLTLGYHPLAISVIAVAGVVLAGLGS